eukprot:scaffold1780_cov90-Skeletonema_dohrnii-CCMP3373.AAC.3
MIAQHIVGLLAVINATLIGASPIRIIKHSVTIIMQADMELDSHSVGFTAMLSGSSPSFLLGFGIQE